MRRFDDYSLRAKMFVAPGFLLVALLGLAVYALVLLNSNEHGLTALSAGAFRRVSLVGTLDARLSQVHAHLYRLTTVATNDTDVARKQALATALSGEISGITPALKAVDAIMAGDATTAALVGALGKTMQDYLGAAGQVISMAAFDAATASIFMGNAERAYTQAQGQIRRLDDIVVQRKNATVAATQHQIRTARVVYLGALVGISMIAILATWIIGNRISRPVVGLAGAMRQLAAGALDTDTPYLGRRDEIGTMAATVQVFKETSIAAAHMTAERERQQAEQERHAKRIAELAHGFDAKATGVLREVTQAATTLQSTATSMASIAEETSRQSSAAAQASDLAATNVQAVASATEELAASVGEIGRQVALSTTVAEQAVAEAGRTNATVKGLAEASQKIGEVVGLIGSIAGQTNLLALNATIEAARAGEAGKGFAVVASEVKNLANQASRATEEISGQINAMQQSTQQVVAAIEAIGTTIHEVSKIAGAIAAAVGEQGAATQEIARNVQQAAVGTAEVSQNMSGVTSAAGETGTAAHQVLDAASSLSRQAEDLRRDVDHFLADVRAA